MVSYFISTNHSAITSSYTLHAAATVAPAVQPPPQLSPKKTVANHTIWSGSIRLDSILRHVCKSKHVRARFHISVFASTVPMLLLQHHSPNGGSNILMWQTCAVHYAKFNQGRLLKNSFYLNVGVRRWELREGGLNYGHVE